MLDGKYIALIVILCLWVVLLIIFGILALEYQKKHNTYQKVKDAYEDKFHKVIKENEGKNILVPIETNIELPEDEDFYDIEKHVSVYITDKKTKKRKNKKSKKMSRKELWADYDEYYGTLSMKDVFGLGSSKKKYDYPDISGNMYVTNKRILFKSNKEVEEINMDDVKSCTMTVIYLSKDFYAGFALITNKATYQVINDDPKSILIIQQLLKGKENEND